MDSSFKVESIYFRVEFTKKLAELRSTLVLLIYIYIYRERERERERERVGLWYSTKVYFSTYYILNSSDRPLGF